MTDPDTGTGDEPTAGNIRPPARLPPDPVRFTGRTAELCALDLILADAGSEALALPVVTGPRGSGKTSLAAHWLHQVKRRYDGGACTPIWAATCLIPR